MKLSGTLWIKKVAYTASCCLLVAIGIFVGNKQASTLDILKQNEKKAQVDFDLNLLETESNLKNLIYDASRQLGHQATDLEQNTALSQTFLSHDEAALRAILDAKNSSAVRLSEFSGQDAWGLILDNSRSITLSNLCVRLALILLFSAGILILVWYVSVHMKGQLSSTLHTLRSTVDRLEIATRAGGVGIWEYDALTEKEIWNDQMYRLYNTDRNSFPDGNEAWTALIHPDDYKRNLELFAKTLTSNANFMNDFRIVWQDGSIHNIRSLAKVQRDATGTATGMIGTNWDITTEKNNEAILQEMIQQAQSANQAKSTFLATMSHEIRTPMNGVIGMTCLLLDTQLSTEQREYADIVRTSGEALLAIINDILDFSKIEARKLELEILNFQLNVTIEDCINILSVKCREKNLSLNNIIDRDVAVFVRGDPGRIRQIILNLVSNAIKFTYKGDITIHTSVESETDKHQTVRISITDTGIGIPNDKQRLLFSPFTQVDNSTTRKYGGTGLGLAISKQLSEMMGGSIGVLSEVGKGSTFWFDIMLEKQNKLPEINTVPIAALEGLRLLIVDDNTSNRLIIGSLLSLWNCRFDEASNGNDALALMEKAATQGDPYAIALLDMQMPNMDGAQLGSRIKQDSVLHETELVMITSIGERGDAVKFTNLGFAGYLTKPLRQTLFHDCLALVAGRKKNAGGSGPQEIVTRHTISEMNMNKTRILLVEDNLTNQILAVKILNKQGYYVETVDTGEKALEKVKKTSFDLILMDCRMEGLDGFETTRRIRDMNISVPVIAMTGNVSEEDQTHCREAGMNDWLAKPIDTEKMSASLKRWLHPDA